MTDDKMPPLGENVSDFGAAASKSVVSLIPWLGPALSEIVGALVPNQRAERIERYLRRLDERLGSAEMALSNLKSSPIYADLFVEGAEQSVRALSDVRVAEIAEIVADGLESAQQEALAARRILKTLGELDEEEIVYLLYFAGRSRASWETFQSKHGHLFEPTYATIFSPLVDREREAMRDAAKVHLERLGLVRPVFEANKRAHSSFDSVVQVSNYEVTELGRVVLRKLKMMDGDDFTAKAGFGD